MVTRAGEELIEAPVVTRTADHADNAAGAYLLPGESFDGATQVWRIVFPDDVVPELD